jgi:hypothetical protein
MALMRKMIAAVVIRMNLVCRLKNLKGRSAVASRLRERRVLIV